MIVSMTAFARQEESTAWGQAIWELKTVNHRYLEISTRLPEDLRVLETSIRELIGLKIKRGKVDCSLRFTPGQTTTTELQINSHLATSVIAAAESLGLTNSQPINPVDILKWPGVIEKDTTDADTLGKPLLTLLDRTLDKLVEARQREGEKIHGMISDRCNSAHLQVDNVKKVFPEVMQAIKSKIMARASEMKVELDNERFEQELVYLAQKLDISEELDRLEAHIEEIQHILGSSEPVGRRLDFLMQEMNREANTLGSKSGNIELSNASLELKVLIEQMREQIQNIE